MRVLLGLLIVDSKSDSVCPLWWEKGFISYALAPVGRKTDESESEGYS